MLDRIELAAAAGFEAIEIQFPYDQNPARLKQALQSAALPLVLFNFPAGDFKSGGQGNAAVPGREAEFAASIDEAYEYAKILQPYNINILSGRPAPGLNRDDCMLVLKTNLNRAISAFSDLRLNIVTEAINTIDVPGFFLPNVTQVAELIASIKPHQLGIQFDIYHMQKMLVDLEHSLRENMPLIRHIQFADAPGRREPGTGSINFTKIFNLIDQLGYEGYVGAEYFPQVTTTESLDWLKG